MEALAFVIRLCLPCCFDAGKEVDGADADCASDNEAASASTSSFEARPEAELMRGMDREALRELLQRMDNAANVQANENAVAAAPADVEPEGENAPPADPAVEAAVDDDAAAIAAVNGGAAQQRPIVGGLVEDLAEAAAGADPGEENLIETHPWRGNVNNWQDDYKEHFIMPELFNEMRTAGLITANERQAAGRLQMEFRANERALLEAAEYGKYKHFLIHRKYDLYIEFRRDFQLANVRQNHTIMWSYVCCVMNRFDWTEKQERLLVQVCNRVHVDINELRARTHAALIPEWNEGDRDLSPIRMD
eukprot:g18692.t1